MVRCKWKNESYIYKSLNKHFIFDQSQIKLHFSIKVPRGSNNVMRINLMASFSLSFPKEFGMSPKYFKCRKEKKIYIIRKKCRQIDVGGRNSPGHSIINFQQFTSNLNNSFFYAQYVLLILFIYQNVYGIYEKKKKRKRSSNVRWSILNYHL